VPIAIGVELLECGEGGVGARYYQPELGRWTQVDPSGLDANAYLYVGGNPVNFVGPSGLLCVAGPMAGLVVPVAAVA
jgi:hypothetical protein